MELSFIVRIRLPGLWSLMARYVQLQGMAFPHLPQPGQPLPLRHRPTSEALPLELPRHQ